MNQKPRKPMTDAGCLLLFLKAHTQNVTQAVAQNDERQKAKAEYTTSQLFSELKLMRTEMKADKAELKADIEKMRVEMKADIEKVRSEMKAEISSVKTDLSKQITDAQRWTITAMFAGLGALAILQKFL